MIALPETTNGAPAANLLLRELAPLAPIRLRTAAEQIADRLATAIALGEYVPGQQLPTERALAARLGVSRASVREAVQRLVASGHVSVRRGRTGGTFVEDAWRPGSAAVVQRTLLDHWDRYEQLLDFRQQIEPLIARLATERATAMDRAAIKAAVAAYRAATDRAASAASDEALHLAVARATRNDYLVSVASQVRAEVSLGFSAEPFSTEIRELALLDHGELADAVVAGDGIAAAAIADRHFRLTANALRDLAARARHEMEGQR